MAEEDEEGQRDEEGVAHSGVLEEVDVAPEGSDKEGYVANDPQHSVHSDHQQLCILRALESLHYNAIIFIRIGIRVHAAVMRIIHNRHLDERLILHYEILVELRLGMDPLQSIT